VSDNSVTTYVENFIFSYFKKYKMKSINNGDVLFFATDSKNASQSLYFFDSAQTEITIN
jgi:hypothetical protein